MQYIECPRLLAVLFLGLYLLEDGACKPLYRFRVVGLLCLLNPRVHADNECVMFLCSFVFSCTAGCSDHGA